MMMMIIINIIIWPLLSRGDNIIVECPIRQASEAAVEEAI